jgi:hypothetical protein
VSNHGGGLRERVCTNREAKAKFVFIISTALKASLRQEATPAKLEGAPHGDVTRRQMRRAGTGLSAVSFLGSNVISRFNARPHPGLVTRSLPRPHPAAGLRLERMELPLLQSVAPVAGLAALAASNPFDVGFLRAPVC